MCLVLSCFARELSHLVTSQSEERYLIPDQRLSTLDRWSDVQSDTYKPCARCQVIFLSEWPEEAPRLELVGDTNTGIFDLVYQISDIGCRTEECSIHDKLDKRTPFFARFSREHFLTQNDVDMIRRCILQCVRDKVYANSFLRAA